METKITIRDVAEKAGVSISSVHIALNGKKGVSEETRKHICKVARELGYHPNEYASSLKRKHQNILIMLPGVEGNNQYFFPPMWQGIHDYIKGHYANLGFAELPYADTESDRQRAAEKAHGLISAERVDGILTAGHVDLLTAHDQELMRERHIPVVYVNSEPDAKDYLCCVEPYYDAIGRTMAELITERIEPYGSIFLLAGNPRYKSHSRIVDGFDAYLNENNITNMVYKDHSWTIDNANYVHILREVMRPDIAACAAVYSQGTILLGKALEESGKTDLFAVGSDLSAETVDRVRRRVFNNVIQKNPYAQGYLGIRILAEHLVSGKDPDAQQIYVGADVVFRSNLSLYEKADYGQMIFY